MSATQTKGQLFRSYAEPFRGDRNVPVIFKLGGKKFRHDIEARRKDKHHGVVVVRLKAASLSPSLFDRAWEDARRLYVEGGYDA